MFMLQIRKELSEKIIQSHYLIMVIEKKSEEYIINMNIIQIQNIVLVEFSVQQIATKKIT